MHCYTSGFVFTEGTVKRLCQELNIYYGSPTRTSLPAARALSRYMADVDRHLKPFPLQPFSLQTERGPKGAWILPTARSKSPLNIDPETHENTVKVKEAMIATGVEEEYLGTFRTYPNSKRPNTWVNMIF